jgi:hypothetical protein
VYLCGSHGTDFLEIWYWGLKGKSVEKFPNIVEIGQKYLTLYMKT